MGLQVAILGSVEPRVDGQVVGVPAGKQRALLALLAVRAPRPVSAEFAAEALWPRVAPAEALRSLQVTVSRLRRSLGDAGPALETVASGYRLAVDVDAIDARRFEALIDAARAARVEGDAAEARGRLDDALRLWRGPALADVEFDSFSQAEIARLGELRVAALEDRIDSRLQEGEHAQVVAELEQLSAEHPSRERLIGLLMLALYRCGRQTDALEVYTRGRLRLDEELGLQPSPELQHLQEAILRHDAALQRASDEPGSGELPSGVVTFVLTDVEGSTRLWELDPEAMAAAMELHDELTARTVQAQGGRLLKAKGEGDATLSVFARASDAVAAAAELQAGLAAASWPAGRELRVRIALHTGEAYERDGDYFGPALNRAARLRALADGGVTLISQATAEIVRDRLPPRLHLVDIGQHELRSLSRPERVFELRQGPPEPVPRPGLGRPTLPRPLRSRAGAAFVGRIAELTRLRELWSRARDGSRAVFVSGEPGIGKTRLAAELARDLHAEEALVLYGRCDEGLAVPYQPFVEALRPHAASVGVDHIRGELGRLAPNLARLLPELDALGEPQHTDPETERFRLFEAVTAFVETATRERPALLVLDDLHWAAGPTLLLLRHLIRSERPLRLLVLGTFRETELDLGHPLAQLLADLQRDASAEALMVEGLDERAIGELLEDAAGHPRDERSSSLVTALHSATGGNPFFIGEVLAHLIESGAIYREGERWTAAEELEVPARLRQVIDVRVARLSAPARRTLACAAVAGPTCTLALLERVLAKEPALPDALEETVAAGLLIETGPAGYAFAHALVRQTIYRGLGSARRMRLHRRVGEALEHLVPVDEHLEALAHHFAHAAADGQAAEAAHYALAAGRSATARIGYEEAAAHYERGLEALAVAQPLDQEQECELGLALAEVRWNAGDRELARNSCLRAAELAQRMGDAERLARAALIFAGPPRIELPGPVTQSLFELLERALAALGDDGRPLRARVMSRLAAALAYAPEHRERKQTLAREALATARRIGEPAALAEVLASTHWATWGPDNIEERLAVNRELASTAAALGDGALTASAHARSATELLELGDNEASRRELRQLESLADALQQRYPRWLVATARAARAHLNARLEESELHAREGLTLGLGWNEDTARGAFAVQLLYVRSEQEQQHETVELAERLAAQYPKVPAARTPLARAYAEIERLEDARAELELLARADFADIPRDAVWLPTIYVLSQVAALLDDARRAKRLYELLLPYADRCVVTFSLGCFGSASRALGLLATALSRFDDAARHLERALSINARIESPLWIAHTQHDFARMLLLRGHAGDRERAHALLEAALATADARGLSALAQRARHLAPPHA